MIKRIIPLIILVALHSCAINSISDEKTVIHLQTNTTENPILISLEKGPEWSHKFTPGPFVIYVYPQVVFWMENNSGEFLKTLYITGANGDFSKHATKKKMDSEFFQKCLPIWSEKVLSAGYRLPGSSEPYPDAVTSATPQSSFDVTTQIGQINDSFTIYAEINKTGDYNAYYTKDLTDWIGQPSLLYKIEITKLIKNSPYSMKPVGHSNIFENHGYSDDFNNIDTALKMVNSITITFQ